MIFRTFGRLGFEVSALGLGAGPLVGTTRLENLQHNVEAVEEGPLDAGLVQRIRAWWATNRWPGLI